ncbi:MAG: T9SS C-terminal target domain-containing protein [Cytophagales bacterium]|nr:MAG: T9SS C-terminal target domain-containing protein [Cytophagales bacterium]
MEKRRDFLAFASITSLGLFLKNIPKAISKAIDACVATTRDVLGPFYIRNSPVRAAMAEETELGQALWVSGVVYNSACEPISGALVELWQASAVGVYDTSSNFKLRAQQTTGNDGAYRFTTVYPGSYDNRPSHIHYRVSVPSGTSLVTQLYFEGDPLIPTDPFAGVPSAKERIKPLDKSGSIWKVNFDVYLGIINAVQDAQESIGYLKVMGNNPFEEALELSWSVYESGHTELLIYNTLGVLIDTLWSGHMQADKKTTQWNAPMGTNAGTYFAKLINNNRTIAQLKLIKK